MTPKKTLLAILSLLLISVFFLDVILKKALVTYLNMQIENHKVTIEHLDLSVLSPSLKIGDLSFRDSSKRVAFNFEELSISTNWSKIIFVDGKRTISNITLLKPVVNYDLLSKVKTHQKSGSKTQSNFKLTIDKLVIDDGFFAFKLDEVKELSTLKFSKINMSTYGIKVHELESYYPVKAEMLLQNHAQIAVDGEFSFSHKNSIKKMKAKLLGLNIARTNETLRSYIPIDITRGTLSIFTMLDNELKPPKILTKVFLDDVDVIAANQDYINTKHFFIEVISAFSNWLLEGDSTERVAVTIPLEKKEEGWEINESKAFWENLKSDSDEIKMDFGNML